MKFVGSILISIGVVVLSLMIAFTVISDYHYSKDVESYWSLADKASTISRKSEFVDKFADALASQHLNGCSDALMLFTPDNSFDQNMAALDSLRLRLHEISKMDVGSFQYQTAIQQITQQEQGEAHDLLSVFEGCYFKRNYLLLWGLWGWLISLSAVVFAISGIVFLIAGFVNKD